MRQPTQKDVEEAKAYLRSRLDAELVLARYIVRFLQEAATKLVSIAYSYGIPPTAFSFDYNATIRNEVNAIMETLYWNIEYCTTQYAVGEDEDSKAIITEYAFRSNHGATYQERLESYTSRFRDDVKTFVAAALLLGMRKDEAKDELLNNLDYPIASTVVARAIAKDGGFLERNGVRTSFGRGVRTSAAEGMKDLSRHAVAEGYKRRLALHCEEEGVIAYACYRGSSYPCDYCDYECSYLHYAWDSLPPFHRNCKCYAVPIYV